MKTSKKIISMMLAFAVAFTALPMMGGTLRVHAASTKKNITMTASASGKTVRLKWNKIKSPQKGYAVFRDGKCIATLSKKKTSFSEKISGTHTYQIKRWTKKKVTKKINGKKKKVVTYKFSKPSNTKKVTCSATKAQTSTQTETTTVTVKSTVFYDYQDAATQVYYIDGKKGAYYLTSNDAAYGRNALSQNECARLCDCFDGTFTVNGVSMIQKNGVTFAIKGEYYVPQSDGEYISKSITWN